MAELFDVDVFILGHQSQEQGRGQAGENLIVIASDHNHGCLLPIKIAIQQRAVAYDLNCESGQQIEIYMRIKYY